MSFKGLSSSGSEKRGRPKDTSEATFKLVMVGDSGVGKSCLLEKLLDISSTNAFISTIGVDVRTHVINLNGNSLKLQLWDTGGQQRYRPVLATCYRNADGIVVVFDVTNAKSFANLSQWMREIGEFCPPNCGASSPPAAGPPPASGPPRGPVPKILVGNKSDLLDRREVSRERAEAFASENGMTYIETSAIATVNIREAFLTVVQASLAGGSGRPRSP